jgi:hypothetical protein
MTVAWGLLSTARINLLIPEAAAKSDLAKVVAVAIEALHRSASTGAPVELQPAAGSVR